MSATSTPTFDTLTGFDVRRLWESLRSLVATGRQDPPASTLPVCIDQSGLKPGRMAPDFTLRRVGGGACALADSAGRRLTLVFVDPGNRRCDGIAEELNRIQRSGKTRVLAIALCPPHEAALWADDVLASFPVLLASEDVAMQYEVSELPCSFLIDEQGRIAASGPIGC